MLGVVHVAPGTFFAVIAASAVAATIATVAGGRGLVVPVVVIELLLGIPLGPYVRAGRSRCGVIEGDARGHDLHLGRSPGSGATMPTH